MNQYRPQSAHAHARINPLTFTYLFLLIRLLYYWLLPKTHQELHACLSIDTENTHTQTYALLTQPPPRWDNKERHRAAALRYRRRLLHPCLIILYRKYLGT